VLGRSGLRDLGDLAALGQGEPSGSTTSVARVERVETVGVEVVDHIADPVFAGEGHLGDSRRRHGLGREQHHLGPAPGHHRAGAPADDPQQSLPLVVTELPYSHTINHSATLIDAHRDAKHLARRVAARRGKPSLLRH
jgi:hypothetical protein